MHSLELIDRFLPASVALDTYLNTSEYDLFATFEIDPKLYNVSVVDRVRLTFSASTAESHMIKKGAGAALDVFDVPLIFRTPELTVSARDDLTLEPNGCGGIGPGLECSCLIVPLRVPSYSYYGFICGQSAVDYRKC